VVSIADILPSVLDLLGVPVPEALDGKSFLASPADPERGVYIETMMPLLNNGWAPLHGWRTAHAKYIQAPRPEFFDLRKDPFELDGHIGDDAPLAQRMSAELEARRANWPKDADLLTRSSSASAEAQSKLVALGYSGASSPDGSIGVLDPKDMLPTWDLIEHAIRLQGEAQGTRGAEAQRKLSEALAKVQRALERSPRDRGALEQEARIFTALGRLDDATRSLLEYVSIRPSPDAYVFLAQLALARGKPGEVEPLVAAALALEPDHGGARIARGDFFASEGRLEEALVEFEEALRADPIRAQGMAGARIAAARKELEKR
jgi:tetratricopeptide (TPR) repeat protein